MMYLSSISSTETYAKVSHFMKKFTLIEFSFVFNWIIVLVGFWYFFSSISFLSDFTQYDPNMEPFVIKFMPPFIFFT